MIETTIMEIGSCESHFKQFDKSFFFILNISIFTLILILERLDYVLNLDRKRTNSQDTPRENSLRYDTVK